MKMSVRVLPVMMWWQENTLCLDTSFDDRGKVNDSKSKYLPVY